MHSDKILCSECMQHGVHVGMCMRCRHCEQGLSRIIWQSFRKVVRGNRERCRDGGLMGGGGGGNKGTVKLVKG